MHTCFSGKIHAWLELSPPHCFLQQYSDTLIVHHRFHFFFCRIFLSRQLPAVFLCQKYFFGSFDANWTCLSCGLFFNACTSSIDTTPEFYVIYLLCYPAWWSTWLNSKHQMWYKLSVDNTIIIEFAKNTFLVGHKLPVWFCFFITHAPVNWLA